MFAFVLSARRKKKTVVKSLIVVIAVAIDQLSKYIISQRIPLGESIPVIKNFFHLTYILNSGAAFGILKNQANLFIIIAVTAIIFILMQLRQRRIISTEVAFCLILAGAISNLVDRIRLGAVIDFLDFRIWPVFNIADSIITAGAILLAYSILQEHKVTESQGHKKTIDYK